MNLIRLFLLSAIVSTAAPAERNAVPEALTAQTIVARAVARAEAQHTRQADIGFESLVSMSIQSLDAAGKVTDTDQTSYRQYPLQGALYEELIAQNGRSLNDKEKKSEEKNKKKFIRDVEKRKERGLHPQPENARGFGSAIG
jgi:hypothetical protein